MEFPRVMAPYDLRIHARLVIPGAELAEAASRAGGPGGQHVNKSNTRVTLRWDVATSEALSPAQRRRLRARLASRLTRGGVLVVHAGGARSRARNREAARERLAELVRDALRQSPRRVATRPGRGAVERRLAEKKRRSARKRERGRPAED
jgi:ribosome-associated protein